MSDLQWKDLVEWLMQIQSQKAYFLAGLFVVLVAVKKIFEKLPATYIEEKIRRTSARVAWGFSYPIRIKEGREITHKLKGNIKSIEERIGDVFPHPNLERTKLLGPMSKGDDEGIIRPLEDSNKIQLNIKHKDKKQNYVNAVRNLVEDWYTNKIVDYTPDSMREAINLHIERKLLADISENVLEHFITYFQRSSLEESEMTKTYHLMLGELKRKGFFFGIFIREVLNLVRRLYPEHTNNGIIREIKRFTNYLTKIVSKFSDGPLDFCGEWLNTSIVLVAARTNRHFKNFKPYLKAVNVALNKGIDHIYLTGIGRNIGFVRELAQNVTKEIKQLSRIEIFREEYKVKYQGEDKKRVCIPFEVPT